MTGQAGSIAAVIAVCAKAPARAQFCYADNKGARSLPQVTNKMESAAWTHALKSETISAYDGSELKTGP
jgi:glutamine amidotransferase-like uncharacterized protein